MDNRIIFLLAAMQAVAVVVRGNPESCPTLPNPIAALPGFMESDVICNYAGYSFSSPYFYWFVLKSNYTHLMDVPLLVFIGSGTESGLLHLFQPGGPYRLSQKGEEFAVNVTESLLDAANVLFVEQPGLFSFSKDKFTGDFTVSVFVNEMLRFLDSFVQYNGFVGNNHVYIVAEGNMAKVGAMLALPPKTPRKYTVRGLIVNNGMLDLSKHTDGLAEFVDTLSLLPHDLLGQLAEESYVTPYMLTNDPIDVYETWRNFVKTVQHASGLPNFLDNVKDTSSSDEMAIVEKYLSQEGVQKALHIRQTVQWERAPHYTVFRHALKALLNVSTVEFGRLMNTAENVDVMFNVGAHAPLSCIDGFQQWAKSIEWKGVEEMFLSSRVFLTENASTIYVKQRERLVYVIYPNDGRVLGTHSLRTYLSSVEQFIKNRTLSGLVEDDTDLAAILQQCSGNGEYNVTMKQCECYHSSSQHFYGADCSVALSSIDFFPYTFTLFPDQWNYYYVSVPAELASLDFTYEIQVCGEGIDVRSAGEIVVAVSTDLTALPDKDSNELFTSTQHIVLEKTLRDRSSDGRIILGIHGREGVVYKVTIESQTMESAMMGVIGSCLVAILLTLLAAAVAICVGCFLVKRSLKGQLSQLKV